MTQSEFAKGWKLLVLQPWGWRYRALTDQGQPTEETKTQMDFYYAKLNWAHPHAWWSIADLYAQGEGWPSVFALKRALQSVNHRYVTMIAAQPAETYESMPEELKARLTSMGIFRDPSTDAN